MLFAVYFAILTTFHYSLFDNYSLIANNNSPPCCGEKFSADKVNQLLKNNNNKKKRNQLLATVWTVTTDNTQRKQSNLSLPSLLHLFRIMHSTSSPPWGGLLWGNSVQQCPPDMWGTSSHIPPLRQQRLGCVSMTLTEGRSGYHKGRAAKKKNPLLGVFFPTCAAD